MSRVKNDCAAVVIGLVVLMQVAVLSTYANGTDPRGESNHHHQQRQIRITEHPHDVTVARDEPATLRCSAQGLPGRGIVWYRDGQLIAAGWRHRRRVVLPGGSLFFLRVKHGDTGSYFCRAGPAQSRNATLTVAYLDEKFRVSPKSASAILGELATLHCRAPRGVPKPDIQWRFNGFLLTPSLKYVIDEDGDLEIHAVASSDAGSYQCVARNVAGVRETPPAQLYVHQRPEIIHPPRNTTASVGSSVTFDCSASGNPSPQITWRRPDGRFRPTDRGQLLRLDRVTVNESGRYQCKAENTIGSAWAWAVLTVVAPPTWVSTSENSSPLPREVLIFSGQSLVLNCPASGMPPPWVFWSKNGMPAEGVFPNGTLSITNVSRNDSGIFRCAAVNEAGSAVSATKVHVLTKPELYPPLIDSGPMNQSLPLKSSALLECQTEASDCIVWYKDGIPLNLTSTGSRSQVQIQNFQLPDSGKYTCSVQRANLASNWSATLSVSAPDDIPSMFQRSSSNLLHLPGSPSQPRLSRRMATSLSIAWHPGQREGSSPFLGYTVEVYSSAGWNRPFLTWSGWVAADTKAWRIAARYLQVEAFTLQGLEAETSYVFVVRAENRNGFSLPSPVSPWFFTSGLSNESKIPQKRKFRQNKLAALQTELLSATVENSSAIRLSWRFRNGDGAKFEGLHLWYRPLDRWDEQTGPHFPEDSSFRTATVFHPEALTSVLLGLVPNTRYAVFAVPFDAYGEGTPSNCRTVVTNEDAPTGPPTKVTIEGLNSTSVLVKWEPPLKAHQSGSITGYQVDIALGESATLLANLSLPVHPTSVILGGLVPGRIYTTRVAAATRPGRGPSSAALTFWTDSTIATVTGSGDDGRNSLEQQTWPILLLGGAFLSLLLLSVAALLLKRRWKRRKALNAINSGSATGQSEQRGALWRDDSRTAVLEHSASSCAHLLDKSRAPRQADPETCSRPPGGNAHQILIQDSRDSNRRGSPWRSCYSDGVIQCYPKAANTAKVHRKTLSMKL